MSADRFAKHYESQQERKKRDAGLVSPDDPPLPETPVEQAKKHKSAGRNDPCPCGSGQKYKKCCGKAS